MAIDAHGAPNSIIPWIKESMRWRMLAFRKGNWKAILVENPTKSDEPFVQTGGEFAGFFVAHHVTRPQSGGHHVRRYVDSMRVPYIVFPGEFFKLKGTGDFGDVGLAINLDNGNESPFIIADAGPQKAPLGEVSIRLAENLGGTNVSPRTGAGMPRGRFTYLVFPRSKLNPAWPVSSEQLQKHTQELLAAIGGWDRVRNCVAPR